MDSQLGKATGKGDAAEQIKTFVTSSPAVCPLLIISYETCVCGVLTRVFHPLHAFTYSSPPHPPTCTLARDSYRINATALNACKEVGLLVADEAHRYVSRLRLF